MTVFLTLVILVVGGALVFRALDNAQQEEIAQKAKQVKSTLDVNNDGKVNVKDVTAVVKKTTKRGRKPK